MRLVLQLVAGEVILWLSEPSASLLRMLALALMPMTLPMRLQAGVVI